MKSGEVGDDDGISRNDTPLTDNPLPTTSPVAGTDADGDRGTGRTDSTPSAISLRKIFFAIGTCAPDLDTLTVYETMERSVLGHDLVFKIIGQSHYIYSKDDAFHELCSCVPLDHLGGQDTDTVDLKPGNERTFGLADTEERYRTTVAVLPLTDFPCREHDLAHRFAPDAYTTIDLTPPVFETHHTYPERDLVVRTRSKLSF